MADGSETENTKETKNIESSASSAADVESNATERFRQDFQESAGGAGNKPSFDADKKPSSSEKMDKLPAENNNSGSPESMEKKPAATGKEGLGQGLQMDKTPAEKSNGGMAEKTDKLPAEKLDKEGSDKKGGTLADFNEPRRPPFEQLATGDIIKRDKAGETLTTPNGDTVSVNHDGTHKIEGDVRAVETKDGVTTVKFGDGSSVSFDDQGILSANRGNQGVAFGRRDPNAWPVLKPTHKVPPLKDWLPNLKIK